MEKKHSIKYNFIMNTILKMSAFIFPLITFPYISRVLGAEINGKLSFADSFVSYFVMLASLGIPTYGIRACAQCRNDKVKLSKTVHELIIISSILTLVSYIALVFLILFVPNIQERENIIFIYSFNIVLSSLGVEWLYQAIEEYGYITYRNIAFKIISIVLMFAFIHNKEDYLLYAAINVIGTVGSNILNIVRLKKYIFIKPLKHYNILKHIGPILVFALFSIASKIYNSLDTVMIGFLSTDTQVGYYSAAVKMKNILISLVTSLGTVLLPRASYYIEVGKIDEFKEIIKKSTCFVLFVSIPLSLFFVVEAKDTILFLAGEDYFDSIPTMEVLIPTIFFIGLSNIVGVQIFVPLKKEKLTVLSTVIGAMVDLILNAILIPRYGSLGAAIGTLVAEGCVLLSQFIMLYKLKLISYISVKRCEIIKIFFATIVATVALTIFKRIVLMANNFISLMFSTLIFFAIYTCICLVLKEDEAKEIIGFCTKRFEKGR